MYFSNVNSVPLFAAFTLYELDIASSVQKITIGDFPTKTSLRGCFLDVGCARM